VERWNLHEYCKTALAFRVPEKCASPPFTTHHTAIMYASIVIQFKDYLYQVGYSEGTRQMLPALVQEFLAHQQIIDISYIEQQKVRAFYEWLQIRPLKKRAGALSDMMIQQYMYALKTFFSWAEVTGLIDYNPISGMKFRRAAKNTREPLSLQEITRLFEAAVTLKETVVLHMFYSCGLRRSEGEALSIGDIHFREQLLYVREGKGARRRVVPLTQKVVAEMEAYYLQDRCGSSVKKVTDEEAFMLNQRGTRLQGEGYIKLLNRIIARAGIDREITLHHLRHSIATHLLQGGMGMEYVRDFLGHRCLESTQIYARPAAEQLKLL
jgi:integrase/recombinase XerD